MARSWVSSLASSISFSASPRSRTQNFGSAAPRRYDSTRRSTTLRTSSGFFAAYAEFTISVLEETGSLVKSTRVWNLPGALASTTCADERSNAAASTAPRSSALARAGEPSGMNTTLGCMPGLVLR